VFRGKFVAGVHRLPLHRRPEAAIQKGQDLRNRNRTW
jgi:hypothetical protein